MEKNYSIDPNAEAALSYLVPPVTGIVVFLLEKKDKYVRFHAMQSIMFGIAIVLGWNIFAFTRGLPLNLFFERLTSMGIFLLWLFLMWKAYNNEEWELPVLGELARKQMEPKKVKPQEEQIPPEQK